MSNTETMTALPVGTWQLDPVHSSVGFEVDYMTGTFKGSFRDVEATLADHGEGTRLEGAAKVASVDVKDENLAAHLQSPEFFDAERHPELRFTATELVLSGEAADVQGEITIKGITRPIALAGSATEPAEDAFGNQRFAIKLATTVDRTHFDLNWNMPLPTGQPALSNDVRILGDLYFVKAA
jgi:polyisoprenoid-binding protein YceI